LANLWDSGLMRVRVGPGSHSHCLGGSRKNWIHFFVQYCSAKLSDRILRILANL